MSIECRQKTKHQQKQYILLCWVEIPYFSLSDTDMVRWSNVQRKAQFPQAYHCSISSSMLPEIDGVMGWTKASDWKAINYFFCCGGWHYHKVCGLAGTTSWAELHLFLWQEKGGYWSTGGCAWHRISINSGAGNVSLSLSLSSSHTHPRFSKSPFFSANFS